MGNTVNNLRYEIKSENCVKDKNNFFINQNIAFLFKQKHVLYMETYFFKIPKKLLTSAFFFFFYFLFFLPRQILKDIDMPRQKPQNLQTAEANFNCCTGKTC